MGVGLCDRSLADVPLLRRPAHPGRPLRGDETVGRMPRLMVGRPPCEDGARECLEPWRLVRPRREPTRGVGPHILLRLLRQVAGRDRTHLGADGRPTAILRTPHECLPGIPREVLRPRRRLLPQWPSRSERLRAGTGGAAGRVARPGGRFPRPEHRRPQ